MGKAASSRIFSGEPSGLWKKIAPHIPRILNSEKNEIKFQSHGTLTLGVEIELQLIDPETQNLASRAVYEKTKSLEEIVKHNVLEFQSQRPISSRAHEQSIPTL